MNKKYIIIIATLSIILLILIGAIILVSKNDKPKQKAQKKETKEEVKVEEKEDISEIADALESKLKKYYIDYYDYLGSASFDKVSDDDKMLGAYLYSKGKITKEIVDDYYNNLFGIELTNYPDLKCWVPHGTFYKYNTETKEYEIVGEHSHGGLSGRPQAGIIKYNNIEKQDGNYVITVNKVFFPNLKDSDGYFYLDYNYNTKITALNKFGGNELSTDADANAVTNYYVQNYDQFKDLKPQYKYTFKKENDDYYLLSFETIK